MNIKTKFNIGNKIWWTKRVETTRCKNCGHFEDTYKLFSGIIVQIETTSVKQYSGSGGCVGIYSNVTYTTDTGNRVLAHEVYNAKNKALKNAKEFKEARESVKKGAKK